MPVTLPRGFLFSVARAAIRKPGRDDLALICSEHEATAAATFTTNRVKAAPVKLDRERIKSGKARAVVINSGNANACTGARGLRDAEEMASLVAKGLGIPEGLVYVCSTGVIGAPLPMARMRPAIRKLARTAGSASAEDAARAIMTTDTFSKVCSTEVRMGSKTGVLAGICKGAGMVAPDMATMLAFLVTDLAVEKRALKAALKEAVEHSFNRITVDGDTSTNDTAMIMANGLAGNPEIARGARYFSAFTRALAEVTGELSAMIARDGEGATKLIEIEVKGARTEAQAKKAALTLANSLLLKTAVYGGDPNVGRVMAALGRAQVEMGEERTDVYIGKVKAVSRGVLTGRAGEARGELEGRKVRITVSLNSGKAGARALTCDLSEDYVRLNAGYTT